MLITCKIWGRLLTGILVGGERAVRFVGLAHRLSTILLAIGSIIKAYGTMTYEWPVRFRGIKMPFTIAPGHC